MRKIRLVYSSLATDIDSCHSVGVTTMPARHAAEHGLFPSVGFGYKPTGRTSPARIPWVDYLHGYARTLGFVFDKALKLVKAPVAQPLPLAFVDLNPRAYALEVFKCNRHRVAFSFGYDFFGDGMVGYLLKAFLLPFKLVKLAASGTASNALQLLAEFGVAFTDGINLCAGKLFAHAVRSNLHNTQIDTKNTSSWRKRFGLVNINDTRRIPLALDEHQVNLALPEGDKFSLIFATLKGNGLSALHRPQVDGIALAEAKDSIVIRLCSPFAKYALRLVSVFQLVGVGNFGNTPNNRLRSQAKPFLALEVS